jgi:hypothetical protein
MILNYSHHHPEFAELIRIVAQEHAIDPALVEKAYQKAGSLYYKGQPAFDDVIRVIQNYAERL